MPDVTGTNFIYPRYVLDSFRGGVHEPESHAIKMGLLRSSYVPDDSHVDLSNVTAHEVSGTNGYSRQTLGNVALAIVGDWVTLNFDPVQFVAAGGNYSATWWFLFNDSVVGGPLICYGQLDNSREVTDEVVLVDTKTLDIACNELGLFRVPV